MNVSSKTRTNTRSQTASSNDYARVKFKSILRIRPMLKKERDDTIVLEPVDSATVALHPSIKLNTSMQSAVQTVQDEEFRFDRVFSSATSQEKIYHAVGQPIARAVMDSLKQADTEFKTKKTTHFVLGMGLHASGKTYSIIGNSHISKRKNETDGIVPRILESLYSQSKHTVLNNTKKLSFAVKLTAIQVNQSKSNPAECELHDLLQPLPKRVVSGGTVESLGTGIGSFASSILGSMDISMNSASSSGRSGGTKGDGKTRYAELDEPVKVQQHPTSSECVLVNGIKRQCDSIQQARESIQKAMAHSKALCSKKVESHVYIEMEPRLVSSRSGRTVTRGEKLAFLDMQTCDGNKQRSTRLRDAMANREDAHAAVMHCLKAIQNNEEILAAEASRHSTQVIDEDEDEDSLSEASEKPKLRRKVSLRKVPFLQHKLTMLLQSLFSTKHSDITLVTLFLAVSPSSRDHQEKKLLLNETTTLYRPAPVMGASTGVAVEKIHKKKLKKNKSHVVHASDADDEESSNGVPSEESSIPSNTAKAKGSVADCTTNDSSQVSCGIESVPSMTYSVSDGEQGEDQLPPPVAPSFSVTACNQGPFSPQASAPVEDGALKTIVPPPVLTVDFPGVALHMPSTRSALTEGSRSVAKSPGDRQARREGGESPKFSYLKTINKVVHASKKKGRKVMERMAVTTISAIELEAIQERLAELEQQSSILIQENERLREENKKLKQEHSTGSPPMMASSSISHRSSRYGDDAVSTASSSSYSTHSEKSPASPKRGEGSSVVDTDSEDSYTRKNNHNCDLSEGMHDNPLFQHMSNLKNVIADDKTQDEDKGFYSDDNDDYDTSSRNCERAKSEPVYDDPLFQHMAMMNY